jgi:hypothetical protein
MQSRKYDYVLTLKITSAMRQEIDEALVRMNGSSVEKRSEFLRMAAAYALASMFHKPRIESGARDEMHEKLV